MFIYSFKASKGKLLAIGITVVVLIAFAIGIPTGILASGSGQNSLGFNVEASTAAEREAFLTQFTWQIKPEPFEVIEVIIPHEFDDIFDGYNEIQLKQGFDLTKFKGTRVKRWTYEITNYPGFENSGQVFANLLIYDGKVIGGDVCCMQQNGFLHGFEMSQAYSPQDTSKTQPSAT